MSVFIAPISSVSKIILMNRRYRCTSGESEEVTNDSYHGLVVSEPTQSFTSQKIIHMLPLKSDVAAALRQWKQEYPDIERVFPLPQKPSEMIKADLSAAGISYKDESGLVADFHALRHTFISDLVRSGASPKVAQTLARHSTITLTMDRYTHPEVLDVRDALEALPDFSSESEAIRMRATGTDGKATKDTVKCTEVARFSVQEAATHCNKAADKQRSANTLQARKYARFGTVAQESASVCNNGPKRTRTSDPRIMSPLL